LVFINELPYYSKKTNYVTEEVYYDDVVPWHFLSLETEIAQQELRLKKIHGLLNIFTVVVNNQVAGKSSSIRMKYKGKYYKIRTGSRGGKYIMVSTIDKLKKKIYI
jgi:hypothetical protein